MAEEEEIYKEVKFKWKGSLDIARMYKELHEWLTGEDFEIKETHYAEKIKPRGKTIEINWECKYKRTDYFLWKINLTFYSYNIQDIEVEKDGKKLKLQNAIHSMRFKSTLVTNADDEFEKDSLWHKFYKKFIMAEKILEEQIELFKISQDLAQEIKLFMELYQIE